MRLNAGFVALALLAAAFSPAEGAAKGPEIASVSFHPPDDVVRFYRLTLEVAPSPFAYRILGASVEDSDSLFVPFIDDRAWQREYMRKESGIVNENIPAGKAVTLHLRHPWENDKSHRVEIRVVPQDATDEIPLETEAQAPKEKGYPFPGWEEHRLLVLAEDYGIERKDEPQFLFVSDYAERVKDWEKELRVARYDPSTGLAAEIPSQVLHTNSKVDTPDEQKEYTTCRMAFLVDVPANGKGFYLLFFGNPDATKPDYATGIETSVDEEGAAWIENDFYRASLRPKSGQLNAFHSKIFGTERRRGFSAEKYPTHYNPDVWVKGRSWSHVSDWSPPPNTKRLDGPVVVSTRRWGDLPWVPEVGTEVIYHFFDKVPYVLSESTMDVREDVVVNALRNEEVVLAPETEIDHIGWRRKNGEVGYKPATLEPGLTRGMLRIVEGDDPYVCMVREEDRYGIAGIRLGSFAGSRGEAPPVISTPVTIFADYGWEFRYWSRSLVYPWGDRLEDIPTVINAGTYYSEKGAYLIFPLGEGDEPKEKLAYLEDLSEKLRSPLRIDKLGAGPW